MEIWTKINKPPQSALKKIQAGRLKGKSDINPQWRYQAMTETFGPCGIGWKFTVDRKWTEPAPEGQVFAFADVSLYINVDGEWSAAIPGSGGSMLVTKESAGLHASDEAYKMAVTDALGTAMKMIGMAAEVYLGNFDCSKYLDDKTAPKVPPKGPAENIYITEVKDVTSREGETNGKAWKKYGIVADDDKIYGTFSESFADVARTAQESGNLVTIYYDVDGKGRMTVKAIEILDKAA